ncbi:histidine ABC transporter substrate-binding protein [Paraburkholderia dipogonis]|uniref:Histidine ABC transporter substrate-binding protein n=1 Tax=Paraburkholderia dipogonis TaxID=1211383 RepID=A0A4Y8MJA4_9BURK|nr:glycine betaine ABC transporter substrate-binding protein [Paraburkholderia dipogonis]TFE37518.1 histidine ABC transporter substrate-binding protein [Paraburkholderia dipogonis]
MNCQKLLVCAAVTLGLAGVSFSASAATTSAWCSSGKPIRFAEVGWDSGKFFTEIARYVVEKGYGCKTETVGGSNSITTGAVATNDLQVFVEYWNGRTSAIEAAAKEGKIKVIGDLVKGGSVEGFYVPEYVVKGDPKRGLKPIAADLKSVSQLQSYSKIFIDPEDPSKGSFLNCPIGWQCESDNTQKLKAYQLDKEYSNTHPGTGAAMDATISSAYERGKPILYYYFQPSTLLARYPSIRLDEPAFNEACWKTINNSKDANPCPSASPITNLKILVSTPFANGDPSITDFLSKMSLPMSAVSQALSSMGSSKVDPRTLAVQYIKSNPQELATWVPASVAQKVEASISK